MINSKSWGGTETSLSIFKAREILLAPEDGGSVTSGDLVDVQPFERLI